MRSKKNQPILITDLRPIKQKSSVYKRLRKYFRKNPNYIYIVPTLLILVAVLGLFLLARHHGSKSDLKSVESKVGKLMLLPKDEQPTLATVENKNSLKDKFLANHSQNGDRVLIYTKNQMVIIYRPSIDKIAAVGSVQIDQALVEAKGATLTVVDGSNNPQKTQEIIKKVKAAYPNVKVVDGGKISRQDFPDTIVIDNSNQKDYLTLALTKVIPAKRGIVPLGVNKANTDLMVIVGADK